MMILSQENKMTKAVENFTGLQYDVSLFSSSFIGMNEDILYSQDVDSQIDTTDHEMYWLVFNKSNREAKCALK
jgi:hypothetical protein